MAAGRVNYLIIGVSVGGGLLGLGLIVAFWRRKNKGKRKRSSSDEFDSDAYDGSTITSSLKSYGNKRQKYDVGAGGSVASKVCHCNKQLCNVCGQLEQRGATQFIPVSKIPAKSMSPVQNIATALTVPTGNKAQGKGGVNIVTPTYADLEAAVLKGDWELVEDISRVLGAASSDEIAKFDAPLSSSLDQDSALSSGLGGTSVVDYGFNALRMAELDGHFEVGDFAAATSLAAKYAKDDYSIAHSTAKPLKDAPKTVEELKEIKGQALGLLERVAPAETAHIDLLLDEFKGKEEMLIEQLTDLNERAVLKQQKAANIVFAKKIGKKQVSSYMQIAKSRRSRLANQNALCAFSHHRRNCLARRARRRRKGSFLPERPYLQDSQPWRRPKCQRMRPYPPSKREGKG